MGTISDKLTYLTETKSRFVSGMTALEYPITQDTTFREMADMLYEEAIKKNLDVDLSDLPEYWHDAMKTAIAYTMILGSGYVHHIITTDNHHNVNYGKSIPIQKILYDTELYSKVINVGDITNGNGSTTDPAVISQLLTDYGHFENDLLLALGNHDDYTADQSQLYPLIANNSSLIGTDKVHFNYYCDDATHHIRYVVMDTPKGGDLNSFLKSAFDSAPSGYGIIIISHYPLCSYTFTVDGTDHTASDATSYGAKGAVFALGKPENPIICVLCGHEHVDHVEDYLGLGLFKQIALLNDGHYWQLYEKEEGTTDENAVTILSVNPTTKDVKLFRIGQVSQLPQRYSISYGEWATMAFHKDFGHTTQGFRYSENMYTCLKLLPLYDADNNLINYYVINESEESIDSIYETHYTDGVYVNRFTYQNNQNIRNYVFTKKPICWLYHGNGISDGATETVFGVYMTGSISADALTLVSAEDDIDLGYAPDDIQWITGIWRQGNNSIGTYSGYIGTAYISVEAGQEYVLSVDDPDWWTKYLSVVGTDRAGAFKSQVKYINNHKTTGDISFTIPDGVNYIQICCDNLANYTDKVSLTLVEADT